VSDTTRHDTTEWNVWNGHCYCFGFGPKGTRRTSDEKSHNSQRPEPSGTKTCRYAVTSDTVTNRTSCNHNLNFFGAQTHDSRPVSGSRKCTYNWEKGEHGVLGGANRVVAKVQVRPTWHNGTHRLLRLLVLCRHGVLNDRSIDRSIDDTVL
jgi:hypothetical protein